VVQQLTKGKKNFSDSPDVNDEAIFHLVEKETSINDSLMTRKSRKRKPPAKRYEKNFNSSKKKDPKGN